MTTMKRTKEAIIGIYGDETGSICLAWDKDTYSEGKGDPVYQGVPVSLDFPEGKLETTDEEFDAKDAKEEQEVTLQVLRWLWRNGYHSATWGEEAFGDGRPSWATKNVYVWDAAA